ncbi:unnamed protein product [Darwinula stevensoni]|uniref:Uncharacterized protein n=1 Tax=Darwinula stevensoni TaxID=69355 RepID=A0A7R8X3S5_9CRUS|nr:unnamed protein product [Darwinula stevensoni]CAG0885305.1 unnamed protein product [Darwinula stevensoni]
MVFLRGLAMRVLTLLGQFLQQGFAQSPPHLQEGNCHVKDRELLCRNVTHLPKPLPEGIRYIHVVDSNIDRLGEKHLESISVETVKFERNVIGELSDGAFRLLPGLVNLHLSENLILVNPTWCTFLGLENLTKLHLEGNQISMDSYFNFFKFDKGTTAGWKLGDLCQCQVTFEKDYMSDFSPCEELTVLPKLNVLILSRNPIGILPGDIFLPLRLSPVSVLHLEKCQLLYVDEGTFAPLQRLQKLSLKNNIELGMKYLARATANINCHHNISLDLSLNDLKEVPSDVLVPLNSTLTQLNLKGCNLETIHKGSFPQLPVLEILDLAMCRIREIEVGSFDALPKLTHLDLSQNRLTEVSKSVMLSTLISLTLDNNPSYELIETWHGSHGSYDGYDDGFEIPPFENMDSLRALSLARSTIKAHIATTTFMGLQTLRRLELSGCGLKSIEAGSFSTLVSLEYLGLSKNHLKIESDGIFLGLNSLVSLFLHDNDLSFTGATSPFTNMSNLIVLVLTENLITHLNENLLVGLESLRILILTDNYIQAWNSPVLGATRSLDTLWLDRNKLMRVTKAMLKDFENLAKLDLSRNPFKCNCELHDFYRWALENEEKLQHWHNEEAYTCWETDNTYYSLLLDGEEIFRNCETGVMALDQGPSLLARFVMAIGFSVLVVLVSIVGYFSYRRGWCQIFLPPNWG